MKILITGASLTGNKGASAMCISVINALRANYGSKVEVGLLSPKPDLDEPMSKDLNIKLYRYGGILRKSIPNYFLVSIFKKRFIENDPVYDGYLWADLIVDIHGINFSDSDTLTSTAIIPSAQIFLAYLLSTPLVKFTQTFGPMDRLGIRIMAKIFLPLVANIFPREISAYKNLDSLHLKNLEKDYVDSAFLLTSKLPKILAGNIPESKGKRIAFIPNAILLSKSKNYIKVCKTLISQIIDQGHTPVIIMHYSRPTTDETLLNESSNNDYQLIQDLVVDFNNLEMYIEEYSSSELKGIIGTCNLAVPSRYHALVASISQSIPSFCVGWAGKYEGLLDKVGMSDFSFTADGEGYFDVENISENFLIFLKKYSNDLNKIDSNTLELHRECSDSYERLFEIIDSHE